MVWMKWVPRKGSVKVTDEEMRKLGLIADEAEQKHDSSGKPEKGGEEDDQQKD